MLQEQWKQMLVVLALATIVLAVLRRRGVFSRSAFDEAPRREGSLGVQDALLSLGLWILGPAFVIVTLAHFNQIPDRDHRTARDALMLMVWAHVGMLPALVFIGARVRTQVDDGWRGWGLGPGRLPAGLLGGAAGLLAMFFLTSGTSVLMRFLWNAFGHEVPDIAHGTLDVILDEPWNWVKWGLIVSAVVAAPLFEEVVFRGMIQTALQQATGHQRRWWVMVVVSLVFAMMHYQSVHEAALPVLFVLSLGLGFVYERTGSLWAPIVLHAGFNAIQIAIVLTVSMP